MDLMRAIGAAARTGPNEDRAQFSSPNFVKTSEAIQSDGLPKKR